MYAKFQDKITNYLEDHMASLIKRTAKDSATIAEAYSKLRLSHAENQSKLDLAMTKSKLMKTQTKLKEQELENDLKNQGMEQRITESKQRAELLHQGTEIAKITEKNKKEVMEAKSSDILRMCNVAGNNLELTKDIFTQLDDLEVYIWGVGGANMKMKGEITKDDNTNKEILKEYNNDEFKINIACSDMTNFNIEGIITSKLKDVAGEDKWELSNDSDLSGALERNIYKVEVAGAKGGKGGKVSECSRGWTSGGEGGNGHKEVNYIVLNERTSFTAEIGQIGRNGADKNTSSCGSYSGENGGDGGDSVLKLGNRTIVAPGGKGGEGGWETGGMSWSTDTYKEGSQGAHGGNGEHSGSGYVRIYKFKY